MLDNCEHLIDAAARLADELLARCPRLRMLATSREPLGIIGRGALPACRRWACRPTRPTTPRDRLAYPSVRLLQRPRRGRAAGVRGDRRQRRPTWWRSAGGSTACPLAIELAAARLRTLSTAQVAARLDDRFRLLTGGSRTALPRHRTLRAVVAWSWDLLTDDERRLVERLAVFPSTITAESAAGVAAPDAPLDTVADLLAALVDKSLLQLVGDGRFRMLETIREYGLERLAAAGEASAAAGRARGLLPAPAPRPPEPHLRTPRPAPLAATRSTPNGTT